MSNNNLNKRKIFIIISVLSITIIAILILILLFINNGVKDNKKEEKIKTTENITLEKATSKAIELYKNEYNDIEVKEENSYYIIEVKGIETGEIINKFKLDKKTGDISIISIEKTKTTSSSN